MPEPILAFVPLAADIPPGVALDSIVADVTATGVSAPADVEPELQATVERAANDGIDLSVVVLESNVRHDSQLRDLATAVGSEEGGTVLVLSPGQVGTFSDSISRVVLEAGQDRTYTGDPVLAAGNFLDTIVEPQDPWTAITGVLIVVVAACAGATAAAKIRRRSRTADGVSADEAPAGR